MDNKKRDKSNCLKEIPGVKMSIVTCSVCWLSSNILTEKFLSNCSSVFDEKLSSKWFGCKQYE